MIPRVSLVAAIALVLAGCGPHRYTPAEQAARKQADAAKQRADAAKKVAKKRLEARINREKWLAEQLAKPPLPPGVAQVGSRYFYTDRNNMIVLRHVCQDRPGTSYDNSGNDVDSVHVIDGMIQVKCKQSQFRWRDATLQRALVAKQVHQPANGALVTPATPSTGIVVEHG